MTIWGKYWAAFGFCLVVSGGAGAVVSQVPLTGTTGSVMPNLMFTLDDSSSMVWECVPDPLCIGWRANSVNVTPWNEVATSTTVAIPLTYNTNTLVARRLRSSAINPIYYNPQVRYLPWLKANGLRYPEYPASAAPIDPNNPSRAMNLVHWQTINSKWAGDDRLAVQVLADETIWAAQYYQLGKDKKGDVKEDFTQIIISPENPAVYPKFANRTDCAGSSCTYEEEAQNFSNWFTYARNRLKVAKGGTAEAFGSVPSGFRVGYGTINSLTPQFIDGVNTKTILMGVRPFAGENREAFYKKLLTALPMSGTPLRSALDNVGRYFEKSDAPWAADPSIAGQLPDASQSCRRSFHVLMTDGMWSNEEATTPALIQDVDSLNGPRIAPFDKTRPSFQYRPAAPYAGTGPPNLADVAMYYWNRDLRDNLKNDVPPSESDPAFWQHLVTYTIGLGIAGKLRPDDWQGLAAGNTSWGSTQVSGSPERADDLWHAAVNSRGRSALASSVSEYTAALKSMVETIVGGGGREAGTAVSGRSYSADDSVKYIPSYKPGDWIGEVEAQKLADGSKLWSASQVLPAHEHRNIYTLSSNSVGVAFDSAMNNETRALLATSDPGRLVNYIRGDQSGEAVSYRKRISLLGDIVNSTPILVKDLVDSQYDFLPSTAPGRSSYLAYLKTKKFRMPQLFVGANDGMLHAFDANSGVEGFAYIPRSVLGRLKNLANPAYDHQYFVDGPSTEADIYDSIDAKWRNVVVGSTGAGAKSLFAINVPVPVILTSGDPEALSALKSAPGAADILWEVNSDNPDYSELGNVLQAPETGVMQDGTWVIITGNGYDSASGRAKLYVINARTGARVAVLNAGSDMSNGLGGVKLVRDSNKRIVAAYAGDLAGHMWKFDLSSATPSEWTVAFSGLPLFSATNSAGQPESFTASPAVMPHPLGGVMVLAGTGKLFERDDASSTSEKSLYGVWDKPLSGGDVKPTDLVTQTIQSLTIDNRTGDYFSISNNGVDYGSGATARKRGWMIRMTIASGQRLIYAPQLESGRVIFDTMVPGGVASGCTATQPQGYTFVLDPFTGAPGRDGPTFDTNSDGLFTSTDNATAAVAHFSSIGRRPVVYIPGTSRVRLEGSGAGGGTSDSKQANLGGTPIRRQWRQIITPPAY
ncbi:Tfp pilus assembly protein, tip-associated adhesin PilY1 [Variovorax sp. PBS-H4]|uniref:pilus assembly protein n=1 Tax=Variovorax sp. PBS-H4 TaxID=434008 RepID=UPI001317C39E|nr:PilC/PilY family type IV pilus protein [Variovorax sp. PBS-H4]VTU33721.1 Tfp pilus assembly protein, tip-associated adhesin PilY1 [Variovorax sp. PBS-H4]